MVIVRTSRWMHWIFSRAMVSLSMRSPHINLVNHNRVMLFGSSKHYRDAALCDCVLARPDHTFDLCDFCKVLEIGYNVTKTPQNTQSSFRRAGLWPTDLTRILGAPLPATAERLLPYAAQLSWRHNV